MCMEILRMFDQFAKEHHLTYYMAGGTLLGAVRHKGFIPWDDDVDLMMPRPDYEKLIRIFRHERYRLEAPETNPDYTTPFVRIWDTHTKLEWDILQDAVIGIFIDIFPIDGFPSNDTLFKLHVRRLKLIRTQINAVIRKDFRKEEKYRLAKKILKHVWRGSGNDYCRKLNRVAKKYDFNKCSHVGVTTTTDHLLRERNPKKIFAKTVYMQFEDMKLPGFSGYDHYLRHLYGDYMKLPPEDQRVGHHLFKAYQIK